MPAAKVLEPEPNQGPRKTTERLRTVRTQRAVTERAKPERTGPDLLKADRPRPEKAKPERTGHDLPKADRPRPEKAKPERTGPTTAKPDRVKAAFGADAQLRVPAERKGRTRSCPREQDRDLGRRRCREVLGPTGRVRSSSAAAPRPPGWRIEPAQREPRRSVRVEDSHKAFTVIPPNPKKRREIQRKAEAELAALEGLRLSRAMAYVSINPSSVGGCMSLEEVRLKQQEEMLQAKRKVKLVKKQLLEETSVVRS